MVLLVCWCVVGTNGGGWGDDVGGRSGVAIVQGV